MQWIRLEPVVGQSRVLVMWCFEARWMCLWWGLQPEAGLPEERLVVGCWLLLLLVRQRFQLEGFLGLGLWRRELLDYQAQESRQSWEGQLIDCCVAVLCWRERLLDHHLGVGRWWGHPGSLPEGLPEMARIHQGAVGVALLEVLMGDQPRAG